MTDLDGISIQTGGHGEAVGGDFPSVGPRGGMVSSPEYKPEWRRQGAKVEVLPNGELALHKFEPKDTAALGVKNEMPWHRMAAYMLAANKSLDEVARAAGVAKATVSHLNAQVWFQQLKAIFANEVGRDVLERMKAEANKSLDVMLELRDSTETDINGKPVVSPATRHAICRDIIEQVHGKAVQKVVSINANTQFESEQAEREFLQQELQAVRAARGRRVQPSGSAAGDDGSSPILPTSSSENI